MIPAEMISKYNLLNAYFTQYSNSHLFTDEEKARLQAPIKEQMSVLQSQMDTINAYNIEVKYEQL